MIFWAIIAICLLVVLASSAEQNITWDEDGKPHYFQRDWRGRWYEPCQRQRLRAYLIVFGLAVAVIAWIAWSLVPHEVR
jgi:hypothetical protein